MYLERIQKLKPYLLLYWPIPVSFILLMAINFILSASVDTNKVMQESILNFGVNRTFLYLIAPLALGLLIVLVWVKFIQRIPLTVFTTGREKIDWKRIGFSFTVWAVFTIVMTLWAYYIAPENFQINFQPVNFAVFFIMAIILIPMQTSFEEYLFRGQILQGLSLETKSRFAGMFVSSVLFGLMHAANPEVEKIGYYIMIYYIGTGFFLGIITLLDDGMELALGFHAANNLVGALLVTSDWTAFQTYSVFKDISEPSIGFDVLFPIVVIYPVLIFVFAKKYNWHDWKTKLFGTLKD
ncbi:CPBP family intramembrane metalloprotease [Flavobacterium sp. NRK F10]|uniref:CPBP family intramembrane glutamic endopeptidase n=1 Tax=Flavobacterium sp. NRK F10 TaxID=2954931 RepID=UPI0020900EA7|nr:CPBP family intramembrane glutamic endopeptidase [Flavobacterium sp. NRK F10]MCO6176148.1 CPBP family intramembrane metalloprotease [Flavobacterium sp. NRK F10]